MRPACGQFGRDMAVNRANVVLGVEAARDTGLIGNHEHEQAGVVQRLDRRLGAFDPAEASDRANIPVVMVQHAVAVEKGSRPLTVDDFSPGAGQVVGHADVDKVAVVLGAEQKTRRSEPGENVPFERTIRLELVDQGAAEGVDTAADEPRAGLRRPLGKARNPVAGHFDRAKSRRIGKAAQRNKAERRTSVGDPATELREIDVKPENRR